MGTASARTVRTSSYLKKSATKFSDALGKKDYSSAAKEVISAVFKVGGKEGLFSAFKDGNSFYERRARRGI